MHLRSPQGLLVAAACGVSQALVSSEPLFTLDVASLADVEKTLRQLR